MGERQDRRPRPCPELAGRSTPRCERAPAGLSASRRRSCGPRRERSGPAPGRGADRQPGRMRNRWSAAPVHRSSVASAPWVVSLSAMPMHLLLLAGRSRQTSSPHLGMMPLNAVEALAGRFKVGARHGGPNAGKLDGDGDGAGVGTPPVTSVGQAEVRRTDGTDGDPAVGGSPGRGGAITRCARNTEAVVEQRPDDPGEQRDHASDCEPDSAVSDLWGTASHESGAYAPHGRGTRPDQRNKVDVSLVATREGSHAECSGSLE